MKICVDRQKLKPVVHVFNIQKNTNATTMKCVRRCSGSVPPSLHAQEENVLPQRFTFHSLHGEVN